MKLDQICVHCRTPLDNRGVGDECGFCGKIIPAVEPHTDNIIREAPAERDEDPREPWQERLVATLQRVASELGRIADAAEEDR